MFQGCNSFVKYYFASDFTPSPQATKLYEFYKFSVTLGCGGSSSENCTYFEVTGANDGACSAQICKISSDVCQVI